MPGKSDATNKKSSVKKRKDQPDNNDLFQAKSYNENSSTID